MLILHVSYLIIAILLNKTINSLKIENQKSKIQINTKKCKKLKLKDFHIPSHDKNDIFWWPRNWIMLRALFSIRILI